MKTNLLHFVFLFFIFIFTPYLNTKEINIYSHRQPFLINPFLELFTEETGIKTNVVFFNQLEWLSDQWQASYSILRKEY